MVAVLLCKKWKRSQFHPFSEIFNNLLLLCSTSIGVRASTTTNECGGNKIAIVGGAILVRLQPKCTATSHRYHKQKIHEPGWYTKKRRRPPPSNKHHYTGSPERKRDSIAKTIKKQNISKSNSNYNCYTNSNRPPFSAQLFFNPWIALADVIPTEDLLCDKVESTTRTFGIVAALMASLAAALITFMTGMIHNGYIVNLLHHKHKPEMRLEE